MRVLLIAGGWSSEREVSLSGAGKIQEALLRLGHAVDFFDLSESFAQLPDRARACDFAFINLHGSPGEDGLVQAMLDRAGCPYQGAGPAGSFLALHKAASKTLFRDAGLPTPAWVLIPRGQQAPLPDSLRLPVFVKPNMGGSSLGAGRVTRAEEFAPALAAVFALGEDALVEEMVPGQEITCGVLDGKPLPLILIRPAKGAEFFDYAAKYQPQGAEEICPAPIPEALTARIQELAVAAHQSLGLAGYSRADFMVRDGEPWLLEVNTLPGMTATSLLPQAAARVGLSFEALVARLIELGLAARRA
jgi:D-alanine-D-alanine ligase